MKRFCLLPILLLLAFSLPARAGDPVPEAAKAAIDTFHKAWKSDREQVRMDALLELARTRYPAAIREIGKVVLTDPSPSVREAGALALSKADAPADVAGPILRDRLPKEEDHPEVQVALIRAIASIGYQGAHDQLVDAAMHFLDEDYRFVTSAVMQAFGKLDDKKALPFLLALLEYQGEILRGHSGPRVRAGSVAEAKRIYEKKYKKFAYPKGTPEVLVKWWLQDLVDTLKKLTGKDLESAEDLRSWMKDHAKELGFRRSDLHPKRLVPKKPKKPTKADRKKGRH